MDRNRQEPPALPNNFQGKKPEDCSAPHIGSPGLKPSPNSHERGKDGTQK